VGFGFDFIHKKNCRPVCCSTNKLLKTWLGKAKFFAYVLTRKESKKPAAKIQNTKILIEIA